MPRKGWEFESPSAHRKKEGRCESVGFLFLEGRVRLEGERRRLHQQMERRERGQAEKSSDENFSSA